jgi:hypothetical protein
MDLMSTGGPWHGTPHFDCTLFRGSESAITCQVLLIGNCKTICTCLIKIGDNKYLLKYPSCADTGANAG